MAMQRSSLHRAPAFRPRRGEHRVPFDSATVIATNGVRNRREAYRQAGTWDNPSPPILSGVSGIVSSVRSFSSGNNQGRHGGQCRTSTPSGSAQTKFSSLDCDAGSTMTYENWRRILVSRSADSSLQLLRFAAVS
jgi:hypothetical protein